MSSGSKEQELPPLDVTAEDRSHWGPELPNESLVGSYRCRERQLREALAQIATLSAQLEGIGIEQYLSMKVRAEGAESKVRTLTAQLELNPKTFPEACALYEKTLGEKFALERSLFAMKARAEKAEAELAALERGAKVTYRVEGLSSNQVWYATESAKTPSGARLWIEQRKAMPFPYCEYRVAEFTTITRERILDADGGEG